MLRSETTGQGQEQRVISILFFKELTVHSSWLMLSTTEISLNSSGEDLGQHITFIELTSKIGQQSLLSKKLTASIISSTLASVSVLEAVLTRHLKPPITDGSHLENSRAFAEAIYFSE